jgi:hypothetical protein
MPKWPWIFDTMWCKVLPMACSHLRLELPTSWGVPGRRPRCRRRRPCGAASAPILRPVRSKNWEVRLWLELCAYCLGVNGWGKEWRSKSDGEREKWWNNEMKRERERWKERERGGKRYRDEETARVWNVLWEQWWDEDTEGTRDTDRQRERRQRG